MKQVAGISHQSVAFSAMHLHPYFILLFRQIGGIHEFGLYWDSVEKVLGTVAMACIMCVCAVNQADGVSC